MGMPSLVVLISGNGSNLQAIIDACDDKTIKANISAVISNRPDAGGLKRAGKSNIPALCLDHTQFSDRESFDTALVKMIEQYQPDLVVLAGFMRILSPSFIQRFSDRILNIHPSLLPKFPGLNTHARAIKANENQHGCSVHFVTEALDGGPLIAFSELDINPTDTPDSLAQRILTIEHNLYPKVIALFVEKRLYMKGASIELDGKTLTSPVKIIENGPDSK